jgi:hypothetical protein
VLSFECLFITEIPYDLLHNQSMYNIYIGSSYSESLTTVITASQFHVYLLHKCCLFVVSLDVSFNYIVMIVNNSRIIEFV